MLCPISLKAEHLLRRREWSLCFNPTHWHITHVCKTMNASNARPNHIPRAKLICISIGCRADIATDYEIRFFKGMIVRVNLRLHIGSQRGECVERLASCPLTLRVLDCPVADVLGGRVPKDISCSRRRCCSARCRTAARSGSRPTSRGSRRSRLQEGAGRRSTCRLEKIRGTDA